MIETTPKYSLGDQILYEHLMGQVEHGIITMVYDAPDDSGMWWYMVITVGEKTSSQTPEADIRSTVTEFKSSLDLI